MKHWTYLTIVGLSLAVAEGGPTGEAAPERSRKPNIIFILADDLGWGELGCYGQKIIRTPNIDRLAAEGMKFEQHYSGSPVCAPSRCVLMTGLHSGHAYIRNNGRVKGQPEGQNPIPDSTVTIAELLKAEGYATGAMGKWGLGYPGSEGDPNNQGFDLFFGYNCQAHAHNHYPRYLWKNDEKVQLEGNTRGPTGKQYSQDLFTREALRFIREHKDEPFFLYLPFTIPHLSIQVPEESLAEYKGKVPEAPYKHTAYLEHPFPRAGYAAMISHMDRGVGKIMALVRALGLDDDTIVFFSSDNGPTYNRLGGSDSEFFKSAGPFSGLKGSVGEGGLRVPMIARWPGRIEPGATTDHISAFQDVLPTLCELTGVKAPKKIDGISFAPTLLGRANQRAHEYLYFEFPGYGGQQAVRMGDWKAVRRNMNRGEMQIHLYNLREDIAESRDVSSEHPGIVQRIERIMRTEHTPSRLFPMKPLDGL